MELTDIQTNEAANKIKDYINGKNHYCRVGWAIEEIMHNGHKARIADITKVSALLVNTGEYYMKPSGYDAKDNDIFPVNKLDLNMKKLNQEISELRVLNLKLQNKQLRNKIIYAIVGSAAMYLLSNWKDILIMLQIIDKP